MMKLLTLVLTTLCLLMGCSTTADQEARVANGSFAPTLHFTIRPNTSPIAEGEVVAVTHTVRNDSTYPVWVCRLGGKDLTLRGRRGTITVVTHPTCDQVEVLGPNETMTWLEDLDLKQNTCMKTEKLVEESPEFAELLPPCLGALNLESVVAFHLAPPGKRWPNRWVPVRLSAESTLEVHQ